MLNVCDPGGCARLENIMNRIHVEKTAALVDMDKVYNPKEGNYLVFIIYREKPSQYSNSFSPSRPMLTAEEDPGNDGSEYPKIEVAL